MPKAKKTEEKAAEATVEEKAAPKKEAVKAAPKAPAKPKMLVGLEHLPNPDTLGGDLGEFITLSYNAMLGRDPSEKELAHHTRTVETHKRPRTDIHTDIRKGGEYQTLNPLVPSEE